MPPKPAAKESAVPALPSLFGGGRAAAPEKKERKPKKPKKEDKPSTPGAMGLAKPTRSETVSSSAPGLSPLDGGGLRLAAPASRGVGASLHPALASGSTGGKKKKAKKEKKDSLEMATVLWPLGDTERRSVDPWCSRLKPDCAGWAVRVDGDGDRKEATMHCALENVPCDRGHAHIRAVFKSCGGAPRVWAIPPGIHTLRNTEMEGRPSILQMCVDLALAPMHSAIFAVFSLRHDADRRWYKAAVPKATPHVLYFQPCTDDEVGMIQSALIVPPPSQSTRG